METKNQVRQPSDYAVGERVEFHDPHVNETTAGIIREIQIPDGESSGNWSQVEIRIETDGGDYLTFYTGLFADTDTYWFGGNPESECTPEERGCYSIRKLTEPDAEHRLIARRILQFPKPDLDDESAVIRALLENEDEDEWELVLSRRLAELVISPKESK